MSEEPQQVELLGLEIESMLSFFVGITSTKALQYLGIPLKPDDGSVKNQEWAMLVKLKARINELLQYNTPISALGYLKAAKATISRISYS